MRKKDKLMQIARERREQSGESIEDGKESSSVGGRCTPGPWMFHGLTDDGIGIYHDGENANAPIVAWALNEEVSNDTALDNARLIAAAPSLLDVLYALIDPAEEGYRNAVSDERDCVEGAKDAVESYGAALRTAHKLIAELSQ